MNISSITPEEQLRLLNINTGDWKNPPENIEVAMARVQQSLSFLSGNQSDVWEVRAQINVLASFEGTSDAVVFFRNEAQVILFSISA